MCGTQPNCHRSTANKIKSGEDAFVVWMDLQNAFGSIRHNLVYAAFKFYGIPDEMINLLKSLYNDCSVKVQTNDWSSNVSG